MTPVLFCWFSVFKTRYHCIRNLLASWLEWRLESWLRWSYHWHFWNEYRWRRSFRDWSYWLLLVNYWIETTIRWNDLRYPTFWLRNKYYWGWVIRYRWFNGSHWYWFGKHRCLCCIYHLSRRNFFIHRRIHVRWRRDLCRFCDCGWCRFVMMLYRYCEVKYRCINTNCNARRFKFLRFGGCADFNCYICG